MAIVALYSLRKRWEMGMENPTCSAAGRGFDSILAGKEPVRRANRRGFSLIELIFTIILLGIIFITVAQLLLKAADLDIASLEGEALYRSAALMQRIASMPHNSVLYEELNTTTRNEEESKPNNLASLGRIALYDRAGLHGATAADICDNNNRREDTTRKFAEDIIALNQGVPVRYVRLCAGYRVSGASPQYEAIGNVASRKAINEWDGFVDDHDRFVLTVRVRPFLEPSPGRSSLSDMNISVNWGNLASLTDSASPNTPSNLLLITITATAKGMTDPIGELNYVAANIGALR